MRDLRSTILVVVFGIFFVMTINGTNAGKSELYRTYIQGVGNNTKEELVIRAFRLGLFFGYEGPIVPNNFKPLKTISKEEKPKVINEEVERLESFDNDLNQILENNNNTSNKTNLTGIEKAIKDGMLGQDIITNGITIERLKFTFTDGNLQMYYSNWEDCLEDAITLKILK